MISFRRALTVLCLKVGSASLLITLAPLAWAQVSEAASAPPDSVPASAPLAVPAAPQPQPVPISPTQRLPTPTTLLPPPMWQGLSGGQQLALAPLARDWDQMEPDGKSKWLEVAARLPTLPSDEQARMQERMRGWSQLSPAERQQARIGFQAGQQLRVADRQAKWDAYQALPPERRQELADKAAQRRAAKPTPVKPVLAPQQKSNLVPALPKGLLVKPVAPSVLQAKPGASTVLITQAQRLPAHQQAGQTKVFADPSLVDSKTLLPKQRPATAPR